MVVLIFQPVLAATSAYKLVTWRQFLAHGQSQCVHIWEIHRVKKGEKNANATMLWAQTFVFSKEHAMHKQLKQLLFLIHV